MSYVLRVFFILLVISTSIVSCSWTSSTETKDSPEIEKWKLGWRLVNSSWEKNYRLGEQQFDSLLKMNGFIETKFIVAGLDILSKLGKKEKLISILSKQDERTLDEICNKELFTSTLTDIQICNSIAKETIGNTALQIELIKMFINDQSVRGTVLSEMIKKYKLEEFELTKSDGVSVDKMNRDRLKEIIDEFGFPTRQLVGKDAMQGIFLIIQHSDGDKEWQKKQLSNIERAVKRGDMDGQSYAYLYDRIKINAGQKQLYGTQFKNVDTVNKKIELEDIEDIENLDKRRMEIGIMPIHMFEQFILKNLPK